MEKSNRLIHFDLLKLFAIYLVLIGHCVQHLLPSAAYDEPVYVYIYSFHMPLFIMISGYFSYNKSLKEKNYAIRGVSKKFHQLIVPSLTWMIIHYILSFVISFYNSDISSSVLSELLNTLWFLKSLFICYIVLVLYTIINKRYLKIVFLILIILLSQLLTIYHLKIMLPCFLVGVALRKGNYIETYSKTIFFVTTIIFIVGLSIWDDTFFKSPSKIFSSILLYDFNPFICFAYRNIISLIVGISGSLCFTTLFYNLFKMSDNFNLKKLAIFGQYTMGIYVFQSILLEMLLPLLFQFTEINIYTYAIYIPIISIFMLFMCIGLTKLCIRNSISSTLLLGLNR